MKNEKVGLTSTNWILSILGIMVLSCLIILPPVFRQFFKEEQKIEEPKFEEEEVAINTLTCQNPNVTGTNYQENVTLVFNYRNNKIQNFSRQSIRTYSDPIIYQEEKLNYGKLVTAFSIIGGYQYSAIPNDDTSSVEVKEDYDLATFKPTTVTVPGDENPIAITTNYQLNDDINSIKENLTTSLYTCTENK